MSSTIHGTTLIIANASMALIQSLFIARPHFHSSPPSALTLPLAPRVSSTLSSPLLSDSPAFFFLCDATPSAAPASARFTCRTASSDFSSIRLGSTSDESLIPAASREESESESESAPLDGAAAADWRLLRLLLLWPLRAVDEPLRREERRADDALPVTGTAIAQRREGEGEQEREQAEIAETRNEKQPDEGERERERD